MNNLCGPNLINLLLLATTNNFTEPFSQGSTDNNLGCACESSKLYKLISVIGIQYASYKKCTMGEVISRSILHWVSK